MELKPSCAASKAMSMYFGDVVCHPTGVVRKEVTRNDHRAQVQSSSRKVIEKHLLGRLVIFLFHLFPWLGNTSYDSVDFVGGIVKKK